MKSIVSLLALVVVLGVLNNEIRRKENIVDDGVTVLLELAPRDPRSIMQGDYMVLRYAVARDARVPQDGGTDGALVLALDENRVATFRRIADDQPLAEDELLLDYRYRRGRLRLGAESYFFEEGSAPELANARYGELRVNAQGESVLIGMRDASFNVLGERVVASEAKGLLIGD